MTRKQSAKDIAFEKERIKFRREIRQAEERVIELLKHQTELEDTIRKQDEEIQQLNKTIEKLVEYSGMTKEELTKKIENEKKAAGLADTLAALTRWLPYHQIRMSFSDFKEVNMRKMTPEQARIKRVRKHREICKALNDTYAKKNADYGNAFGDTFQELGIVSAVTRIIDKTNRLKSLCRPGADQKVNDESVRDTLLDLANYAIMTVMEMDAQGGDGSNG